VAQLIDPHRQEIDPLCGGAPEVFHADGNSYSHTIAGKSQWAGNGSFDIHPRPIRIFKLLTHNPNLRLNTISLPLDLSERQEGHDSNSQSYKDTANLKAGLNGFPKLIALVITLFGAVVFGYCWWQLKDRLDENWWRWLVVGACGLCLFTYGFGVLVQGNLDGIQELYDRPEKTDGVEHSALSVLPSGPVHSDSLHGATSSSPRAPSGSVRLLEQPGAYA
jgi:hypothetical protein